MIRINYQLNVQVAGGPKLSYAGSLDVDAYDVIHVSVPSGGEPYVVELQPGTESGQVRFLLLTSDRYTSLIYKVNDAEAEEEYALDGPQLLIGSGAVSLLDDVPGSLILTNAAEATVIHVFVGRNATPSAGESEGPEEPEGPEGPEVPEGPEEPEE
jgi:hypothetical protein